jgi:hypothetical protein
MKTNTPLIVDANAVLAGAFAFEPFKMIAWRDSKIIQPSRNLKLPELAPCDLGNIYEPPDITTF